MFSIQAKINESGRVLIPLSLRRALNLSADDDVLLRIEDGELILTPLKVAISRIQDKVGRHNVHQRKLTQMVGSEEVL